MSSEVPPLYPEFAAWLDVPLSGPIPENVVAFNFNLYEYQDSHRIEIVGSTWFDPNDVMWAVDPVFLTAPEYLFPLPREREDDDDDWQEALQHALALVREYLASGQHSSVLLRARGVGCSFVDGDMNIVRIGAT